MPEVATPNQGEREFETGTDEFFKAYVGTGTSENVPSARSAIAVCAKWPTARRCELRSAAAFQSDLAASAKSSETCLSPVP